MDPIFLSANELGIRLEIVGGLPIWEAHPTYRHQKAIDRIRATIQKVLLSSESKDTECACIHVADVYVSFPDGSLKRPDIAIFCQEPQEEDEEEDLSQNSQAVTTQGKLTTIWGSIKFQNEEE